MISRTSKLLLLNHDLLTIKRNLKLLPLELPVGKKGVMWIGSLFLPTAAVLQLFQELCGAPQLLYDL